MHNILNTLTFYLRNPGWQSYNANCRATIRAISSLKRRGLVETNNFNQARYIANVKDAGKILSKVS